jgi:hypothetical protein
MLFLLFLLLLLNQLYLTRDVALFPVAVTFDLPGACAAAAFCWP